MSLFSRPLFYAALFSAMLFMTGCAPSFYNVKEPVPSGLKYVAPSQAQSLHLSMIDERRGQDKVFSSGILPATLKVKGQPVDPPKFLAKSVADELVSRGIPATVTVGEGDSPKVHLKQFNMLNYRSSGFAPFFTFLYIKADLETASGTKRIAAYVRRGKTPVWSFDEVIEPTFNQPLEIAAKEFASKVANALYGYHASDDAVNQLIAKISGPRTGDTYLDVYALGFTNNPAALNKLVELTHDTDQYVRQAAISSLGNMNAVGQLQLLEDIYNNSTVSREDRDIAIKAIGDLGTPDAMTFLKQEYEKVSKLTDANSIWTTRVMSLYF
ncbi:MAG: HEAT repeat domain-containing protein [Steroidobacter sp.]